MRRDLKAHVITMEPGGPGCYSDGVMEGAAPAGTEFGLELAGTEFGLERLTGLVIPALAAGELASEELCLLIQAILDN